MERARNSQVTHYMNKTVIFFLSSLSMKTGACSAAAGLMTQPKTTLPHPPLTLS